MIEEPSKKAKVKSRISEGKKTLRLVFVTRTRLKQAGIHREVTEFHRGFFIYHKEHKEHKVSQRKLKGWGGFSI